MTEPGIPQLVRVILCGLAIALSMVPPMVALNFISLYGVNTITHDDYLLVPMYENLAHGALVMADLTSPNNEHRIFFGRLVMLALGFPTRLNILAQFYASWGFLFAAGVVLACLFKRVFGNGARTFFLFVPVSFLLFNLRAYELYLYGINLVISLMICCFLLSVYEIHCLSGSKRPWLRFICALGSAVIATFGGLASGLAVWPIGLLQLSVMWRESQGSERRRLREMFALWLASSACSACLYVWGLCFLYASEPGHLAEYLNKLAAYALTLFGSPVCAEAGMVRIVGAGMILLYALFLVLNLRKIYSKQCHPGLLPALALILFAGFTNLTIASGRAGYFQTVQATAPRYAIFAMIGLIGLYLASLCSQGSRAWLKATLLATVLGLVISSVTIGYANAEQVGFSLRDRHKKFAYYLHTFRLQSAETLSQPCPKHPEVVPAVALKLEKLGFNVFAEKEGQPGGLPSVAGRVRYAIDRVNGLSLKEPRLVVVRDANRSFLLEGWVFDSNTMRMARKVSLVLDHGLELPVCSGLHRPDVGQVFHAQALANCGFFAAFSTSVLPPGKHTLALRIVSSDGKCVSESPCILSLDVQ